MKWALRRVKEGTVMTLTTNINSLIKISLKMVKNSQWVCINLGYCSSLNIVLLIQRNNKDCFALQIYKFKQVKTFKSYVVVESSKMFTKQNLCAGHHHFFPAARSQGVKGRSKSTLTSSRFLAACVCAGLQERASKYSCSVSIQPT